MIAASRPSLSRRVTRSFASHAPSGTRSPYLMRRSKVPELRVTWPICATPPKFPPRFTREGTPFTSRYSSPSSSSFMRMALSRYLASQYCSQHFADSRMWPSASTAPGYFSLWIFSSICAIGLASIQFEFSNRARTPLSYQRMLAMSRLTSDPIIAARVPRFFLASTIEKKRAEPDGSAHSWILVDLHALDQRAGAEPAAAAHRDDCALACGTLQFVERLGHQSASGRAQRMPQCDRAAVRIDPLHVGLQRFRPAQNHRGERLVDFENIDIPNLETCSRQQFSRGGNRPFQHQHRIASDQSGFEHSRARSAAQFTRLVRRHKEHCGGAVRHLRR